jgi:hypothetical protein
MSWKETDESSRLIILQDHLQDHWKGVLSTKTLLGYFGINYEEEIKLIKKEDMKEDLKVESLWDLL